MTREDWEEMEREIEVMAENYYYEEAAMRTRGEQIIEAVAGIILNQGWENDPALVSAANRLDGFGFDVRWDDGEYISDTDWTRLEDVQLSEAELQEAMQLAREWKANPAAL